MIQSDNEECKLKILSELYFQIWERKKNNHCAVITHFQLGTVSRTTCNAVPGTAFDTIQRVVVFSTCFFLYTHYCIIKEGESENLEGRRQKNLNTAYSTSHISFRTSPFLKGKLLFRTTAVISKLANTNLLSEDLNT